MSDSVRTSSSRPSRDREAMFLPPSHATRRMTSAEYERERAKLLELINDRSKKGKAKRDQALAILFHRSGWTQEELSRKEEVTQEIASLRLMFGRFLHRRIILDDETSPNNLTEARFRHYVSRSRPHGNNVSDSGRRGRNEPALFQKMLELMTADTALRADRRPSIGKELVANFADGKWHALEAIAARLNATTDHVAATFRTIQSQYTFGCTCEKQPYGSSYRYRLFRTEKQISSHELVERLSPIVEALKAEGKKNMATMSPGTVSHLAFQLQQLLSGWRE